MDKLTQEEARIAISQGLKAARNVDERVAGVGERVTSVDEGVTNVGEKVASIDEIGY